MLCRRDAKQFMSNSAYKIPSFTVDRPLNKIHEFWNKIAKKKTNIEEHLTQPLFDFHSEPQYMLNQKIGRTIFHQFRH